MYKGILSNLKFYALLFKFDEDKANELHKAPCEHCGGKLDRASQIPPAKPEA